MILDTLTVLFFISGFLLVLRLFIERRQDVLHGRYVTRERDEDLGLQELEELAVKLKASARELPQASDRHELPRDVEEDFRAELIARLTGRRAEAEPAKPAAEAPQPSPSRPTSMPRPEKQ